MRERETETETERQRERDVPLIRVQIYIENQDCFKRKVFAPRGDSPYDKEGIYVLCQVISLYGKYSFSYAHL